MAMATRGKRDRDDATLPPEDYVGQVSANLDTTPRAMPQRRCGVRVGRWLCRRPLTGARTGWGARPPSIPAVGVGRHHPPRKTPLRAAQCVGVFAVDRENGGSGPTRPDPVRKGRAPCRRGSRDAFACSVPSAR